MVDEALAGSDHRGVILDIDIVGVRRCREKLKTDSKLKKEPAQLSWCFSDFFQKSSLRNFDRQLRLSCPPTTHGSQDGRGSSSG